MNIWQFLDRQIDKLPGWPSGRGLVGASMVLLSVMILWMIKEYPDLRRDDFFKTIASGIIITGLLNSVVGFFFMQNHAAERIATQQASGRPNDPVNMREIGR